MNFSFRISTIATCFLLSSTLSVQAQNPHEIKVGEKIPSINIPNVSNYTNKAINLSSLKGKLIIFDFWFTRCVGCIEGFKKMENLQKEFGDKIEIFIVNKQSQEEINQEYKSMRKNLVNILKNTTLPSITNDTILSTLFPHTIVPHEIWVGPDGIVKAITDDKSVNRNNINDLLNANKIDLPLKKDFLSHNPTEPILPQIYQLYGENIKYYKILTKAIPGLRGPIRDIYIDSINSTVRVTRLNSRIVDLYFYAFQKGAFQYAGNPYLAPELGYGKRILLEVEDSSKYLYNNNSDQALEEWNQENRYCYESVMPLIKNDRKFELDHMYSKLIADLNEYFKLNGRMEKRKINCYVLKSVNTSPAILTKGGDNILEKKKNTLKIQNMPIKMLIREISPVLHKPLIDESKTSENIDIQIDNFNLEKSIKEALLKKGLKLEEEVRKIDMFILTEIK